MIHVKIWSGSGTARITDMTNAGKRGKTCRTLSIFGRCPIILDRLSATDEEVRARAGETSWGLECRPLDEVRHGDYDEIAAILRALAEPETHFDEGTIRGIDAPKPKLVARLPGVWNGGADEDGIMLSAENDVNEWREFTSRQTKAAAYAIAAKVWPEVQKAKTVHEAAEILSHAGARLHGYCGMD